ncbi:TetR/AcrR family transcriptional regulator [Alisedimentitalea sp. MJ-SS2]|uniref:TetR/AcrR family transcriptional regulator n=1 Tax=Aliisedimentitalea sp. MJ-SS2 TaxID=3049795 RepID=UPI002909B06D|nr:TetR/AcrR family transcriptional regulator [Alisedimentitalea sp. MJ-SS2]MDU8927355.1 TetR/AcrR family transcriptional regulator [Alisedimentitalea sp. MJ-SS2]
MADTDTRERILEVARQLLAEGGVRAVTFDGIARKIGHSKQAVLYWYPNKRALLTGLLFPWFDVEVNCALDAIAEETDRKKVIQNFVHAIASFHLQDIERFRMMYMLPQIETSQMATELLKPDMRLHEVTDLLYGRLAAKLGGTSKESRLEAFNLHASVLGLMTMISLTEAVNDPLKHAHEDLVENLAHQLSSQAGN